MQYRLQRNAKRALKRQYSSHNIYKVLKAPCQEYETNAKGFHLSAEEVFYECVSALDEIREAPSEAVFNFQDFWSEKFNEYRELAGPDAHEPEIVTATHLVVLSVVVCLSVCHAPLYNTLSLSLIRQLEEHDAAYFEIQEKLSANISRLGEDAFRKTVVDYFDGDAFLSDEIEDLLAEVHEEPSPNVNEEKKGKEKKLTINQLLIFLDTFLDVGFTSETTNVNAYSRLIGLIAGENPGSIRSAMNRMRNVDYDESEAIKNDVKFLAELLEPVKVELANKLRRQIL